MADALCGPSNALQNFQKHSSVDRTLQQDRLVSRQSPQQDFRTGPGQHAGAIDPEFEAFQAGHPPQPEAFQRFPAQHAPPPNFAGPAALPDWAADFQRMHVSSPPPMQQQQQHMQSQHNHTASWHQDFMRQQQQAASPAPQAGVAPARPMYSGAPMMGYGAGQFAHQQPFMAQQGMNEQPRQKEPVFDDAAFASAFDAAAAEMLHAETEAQAEAQTVQQEAPQRPAMSNWETDLDMLLPPEDDTVLAFMKEHAFNEYCRHQMTEYLPRANTRDPASAPDHSLASLYLGALEKLEPKAFLGLPPDPLLERVLDELVNSQDVVYDEQFMFKARAARLRDQIKANHPRYFDPEESQKAREQEDPRLRTARLRMFQNSLQNQDSISAADKQQLEAAKFNQLVADVGTESRLFPVVASSTITATDIRTTIRSEMSSLNQRPEELLRNMNPPEMVLNETPQPLQHSVHEQQQQQQQQTPLNNDDEELARTAGQLVDSVSHDTSQKFVQSRFLALMRQLRDHEVRVDGDKIVETTPSTIPANQQDLDLGRNGGDDSNRTMTGALPTDGNDGNDVGELRA
ncbi:peroxin 20 [Diplodia corticola]|uniref:Peroxin 20 n=1 Tax=Diplodia corticola TaxID=236234 RepID=A0A1J9R8B3_9PEZI|nr:peroxin 20 [Diplodia corticola]OJD37790.1 peroxin 20 [Diplodia corticola]